MCSLPTSWPQRPKSVFEKSGSTGSLLSVRCLQRREHRRIRRKTDPWHPLRPFGSVGPSYYTRSKYRTWWAVAVLLVSLALGSLPASGQVLYVDTDATGTNDGSSWCDGYLFLQNALAVAIAGDTIRVANGTYRPDQGTAQTTGDRTATFQLITDVTIEGGYAGCGAADPDARDIVANETILSGDLNGNDVGDANREENAYHVVTGSATDVTAILDGFTVSHGNADGACAVNCDGGGMINFSGRPTIISCLFQDNTAFRTGGGVANFGAPSAVTFVGCIFSSNSVGNSGGAVQNTGSVTLFRDCIFEGNNALGLGGGIRNDNSDSILTDCTFEDNHAVIDGGGVVNADFSNARFTNCKFLRNTALRSAGDVQDRTSSEAAFINCLFDSNSARDATGGAIEQSDSGGTLVNCTLVRNTAGFNGGGIYITSTILTTEITNCIVWNNSDQTGVSATAQIHVALGNPIVNHSCILGGWWGAGGTGNISSDPMLDPTDPDNPRLLDGSPCVDAADDEAVPFDVDDIDGDGNTTERIPLDLDGLSRFIDDVLTADTGVPDPADPSLPIVDMGAYEFKRLDCDGDGLPDECELACGLPGGPCDLPGCGNDQDCNGNGQLDSCDITFGLATDCQPNGILDECEVPQSGAVTTDWNAGAGVWSDADNWCVPEVPNNNLPTVSFTVAIQGVLSEVTLNLSPSLDALSLLSGATLEVNANSGAASRQAERGQIGRSNTGILVRMSARTWIGGKDSL